MNVNYTYCGNNFITHTNIKSLCCTHEANIMLYTNLTSIKVFSLTQSYLLRECRYLLLGELLENLHNVL